MSAGALQAARAAFAEASARPYRACERCDYSQALSDRAELRCAHPTALAQPVAVTVARSRGNVCGPDAVLMRRGGWDFS